MVQKNSSLSKLEPNYLFAEVRARLDLRGSDKKDLINLSIGDTKLPLLEAASDAMAIESHRFKTIEGYRGYGPALGEEPLREAISRTFYKDLLDKDEIIINDGAKPDIIRILKLFSPTATVFMQSPMYPAYYDSAILAGIQKEKINFLSCTPENNFFPDLSPIQKGSLIFFCSPNNPSSAVATKDQLETLVKKALETHSIILFDTAYSAFIQDPSLPRSIFSIDGAKQCAIEIGSFSKTFGFTGLRLGYTAIPRELCFDDGSTLLQAFQRIESTLFNGACHIAQVGGLAALTKEGMEEAKKQCKSYLACAQLLKKAIPFKHVYGGEHIPYIWLKHPTKSSWEAFDELLDRCGIVSTPGIGFGKEGEGFLRLSGYTLIDQAEAAAERLSKHFGS